MYTVTSINVYNVPDASGSSGDIDWLYSTLPFNSIALNRNGFHNYTIGTTALLYCVSRKDGDFSPAASSLQSSLSDIG